MVSKFEQLLKKILGRFLGNVENLTLEQKLLRLLIFLSFVFQAISTVLNYFAQQNDEINLFGIISTLTYLLIYFISLRNVNYYVLFYLMVICTLFSVFLAWKYFDGYDGSTNFILLILTILYSLLSKKYHSYIVIFLSLGLMTALSVYEYYNPEAVMNYKDETAKFSDIYFTVLLAILSVFISIKIIFNRYLVREQDRIEKLELREKNKIITKQNEQLKELDMTKNKFFSIISHDLKSPISAIDGLLKMLDSELDDMPREELVYLISVVRKSSNNLLLLTENLLTWASLNTNKISFNPDKIHLGSLVEDNIRLVSQLSARKKISVITNIDEETSIFADKNMLSFVIRNLVSNAIKFSFRNSRIFVNSNTDRESVSIIVADTGIGMTKNQLEKLFRIDYSSSSPGSEGESGSGLGLILCKEFIDRHSGTIQATSEPGKGSTFSFTIPVAS